MPCMFREICRHILQGTLLEPFAVGLQSWANFFLLAGIQILCETLNA